MWPSGRRNTSSLCTIIYGNNFISAFGQFIILKHIEVFARTFGFNSSCSHWRYLSSTYLLHGKAINEREISLCWHESNHKRDCKLLPRKISRISDRERVRLLLNFDSQTYFPFFFNRKFPFYFSSFYFIFFLKRNSKRVILHP